MIENFGFWTVAGFAGAALLVLAVAALGLRRRSKAAAAMIARLESQLSSLKETYGAAPVAGFTVTSDKRADAAELLGRPSQLCYWYCYCYC